MRKFNIDARFWAYALILVGSFMIGLGVSSIIAARGAETLTPPGTVQNLHFVK